METWTLDHPEVGLITVEKGFDAEFAAHNPPETPWPKEIKDKDKKFVNLPADAGLKARLKAMIDNPSVRMQISVNGEVVRQLSSVPNGKVPLEKEMKDELTFPTGADPQKPLIKVTKSFDGELIQVDYRHDSEVVEFDPPEGSRGARRRHAMEESAFKRWAYPLLTGLGKGGWALAVLVFGPLISRIIGWLLSFLPDWELPDWDMPSLPSPPEINLPTPPSPPDITLLVIPLPDWELPHIEIPAWVIFMLDHSKIWVPVVIGLVLGILAIRNHKKSEQTKQEWEQKSGAGASRESVKDDEDGGRKSDTSLPPSDLRQE